MKLEQARTDLPAYFVIRKQCGIVSDICHDCTISADDTALITDFIKSHPKHRAVIEENLQGLMVDEQGRDNITGWFKPDEFVSFIDDFLAHYEESKVTGHYDQAFKVVTDLLALGGLLDENGEWDEDLGGEIFLKGYDEFEISWVEKC